MTNILYIYLRRLWPSKSMSDNLASGNFFVESLDFFQFRRSDPMFFKLALRHLELQFLVPFNFDSTSRCNFWLSIRGMSVQRVTVWSQYGHSHDAF